MAILVLVLETGIAHNFVSTMCDMNGGDMFSFDIASASHKSPVRSSSSEFKVLRNFHKALRIVHGID